MKKIAGLYQSYLKEQQEEFQDYCTGGDKVNELKDFLKSKLNADDFFTAEELLSEVVSEMEEKGFTAGCRYVAALNRELLSD